MIRNLVLIAVAGFFTSMICFAAAFSFGGPDLFQHDWGWPHEDVDRYDDDEDFSEARGDLETARREITFTGETLVIEVPAEVRFTQAAGPGQIVVTGPSQMLDAIRLEDGRLTGLGDTDHRRRLDVAVTAPRITTFGVRGESTLIIEGYDQDRLNLDAGGRADVTARGRVREMTLHIHDRADADLSDLAADDVMANVRSNGEVTLAARDQADLKVADEGKVILSVQPARLNSDVTGQGKVVQAQGAPAAPPAPPPAPATNATS